MIIKKIVITVLSLCLFAGLLFAYNSDGYQSSQALGEVDTVIIHNPGSETFWSGIFPIGSGYSNAFSQMKLKSEITSIISFLKKSGVLVKTTDKIMLTGVTDDTGNIVQDSPFYQLQDFAGNFYNIDCKNLKGPLSFDLSSYKKEIISKLSPQNLIKLIFLNPTIELYQEIDYVTANNKLSSKFIPKPLLNFFYVNDLAVSTNKGTIVGRLANPQRQNEINVMKFLLNMLMIEPIYEVKGEGTFEGGDYITTGNITFLGQGIRTNKNGIKQLLENNFFSVDRVVVVKDQLKLPSQMHLRSYFNMLNGKTAVLASDRLEEEKRSEADVYKFDSETNKYIIERKDIDFAEYLKNELKYKIIAVSQEDQENMAIDFFLFNNNKAIISAAVSNEYKKAVGDAGIIAIYLDISSIRSGGGGVHSVIQVLNRKPKGKINSSKKFSEEAENSPNQVHNIIRGGHL